MEKLIDVNKLEADMYHNAFEIDTDLQKWDSGCWIRYKMFENVLEKQPIVEAEPIRHGHWEWNDYGGFGNYHCTVCRHIPYGKFSRMHRLNYMYCPYCGAKMDEEKENESNL